VIDVRQPWWLLCLRSPFYGALTPALIVAGLFVTLVLGLAGVWVAAPIAAALFLVLEVRSAGMWFRADGRGVHIRNRFFSHHLQWADVGWIAVSDRWQRFGGFPAAGDVMPVLQIARRDTSSITVYATIGMKRAEFEDLGRRLRELSRESGHELPGPDISPAAEAAGL
jgi:hypothetical protein